MGLIACLLSVIVVIFTMFSFLKFYSSAMQFIHTTLLRFIFIYPSNVKWFRHLTYASRKLEWSLVAFIAIDTHHACVVSFRLTAFMFVVHDTVHLVLRSCLILDKIIHKKKEMTHFFLSLLN